MWHALTTSTSTRATARASRRRRSSRWLTARWRPGSISRCNAATSALPTEIGDQGAHRREASTERGAVPGRHRATKSSSTPRPAGARRTRTPATLGAAAPKLMWDGELAYGLRAHVALTYLNAEFTQSFTTGAPPLPVPAGSRLPGVPSKQAYGELAWTPGRVRRLQCGGRGPVRRQALRQRSQHRLGAGVRGRRTCASDSAQTVGRVALREFVRVNNVSDRNYSGSVIVGDTNGRFFEPRAAAQLVHRRERRCRALNRRSSVTPRRRSCCTGCIALAGRRSDHVGLVDAGDSEAARRPAGQCVQSAQVDRSR